MMAIVVMLTLVGGGMLLFVTFRYYWGERGTPPLTGEARRQQKEKEEQLRAKQIEYARNNPIQTRKPSFWDNSKVR